MDNKELDLQFRKILSNKNFFDLTQQLVAFEPEYKKSDFYKATKLPLKELVQQALMFYTFSSDNILKQLQTALNSLDATTLLGAIDGIAEVFAKENEEVISTLSNFSNEGGMDWVKKQDIIDKNKKVS